MTATPIAAYVEVGTKRAFAGAFEWPGWCRSGRDPDAALAALVAYGSRYRDAVARTGLRFHPPEDVSALAVGERLDGDATTDFGAPSIAPSVDASPLEHRDADRLVSILRACWATLDEAVERAGGRELAKGPRGGGRSVDAIVEHVIGAEGGYLRRVGGGLDASTGSIDEAAHVAIDQVEATIRTGVPPAGPRGGKRWTIRYYIRRSAWHVLDHAWEIEDRSNP
jgi:hypothetical protein